MEDTPKNAAKASSAIYKISLSMACLVGVFPICNTSQSFNGPLPCVLSYAYISLWTLISVGAVTLKMMSYSFHKQLTQIEMMRFLNPSEQCVVGFVSMSFSVVIESCCRYTWLFKVRGFIPQYLRFLDSVDYSLHSSSWLPERSPTKRAERQEIFIMTTVVCYCIFYVLYIFQSVQDNSLGSIMAFVICFCTMIFQLHFTASGLMLQRKFRDLNAAVQDVLPFRNKVVAAARLQGLKLCHLRLCAMVQRHNTAFAPGLQASVLAVFCELVVLQYVVVFSLLENPQKEGTAIFMIGLELVTLDFFIRLVGFFLVSIQISGEATKIKRLLVELDCVKSHPDFREEISLFLDQVDSSVTYHNVFRFFKLDERNLCHILASIYSCIFIIGQFGRHCASLKSPCGEYHNATFPF